MVRLEPPLVPSLSFGWSSSSYLFSVARAVAGKTQLVWDFKYDIISIISIILTAHTTEDGWRGKGKSAYARD